jgi:hypothetical protein
VGFAYPFISISIQSFQYCNLAFFLLFPSCCLSFPPWGDEKGHQDTCICLCRYRGGNWEAIREEQYMIKALTLSFHKHNLESILVPTPFPSAWLRYARALQVHTTRILGFSNQKIPQSDSGSKNHFGFLGQINFNKSSTTRMVFMTNPKVVFLINGKMWHVVRSFQRRTCHHLIGQILSQWVNK